MKKFSPAGMVVAILVLGVCGLAWPTKAEEKGPSSGGVDFDALRWKSSLGHSKNGYHAEIFVITTLGGLGGPFVEGWSDGAERDPGLEAVFTHGSKKSWLRLSLSGAPTMSSDLPKELVMRAFFSLPEELTAGDYLLCAPQSEFAVARPQDVWKAKGGLLLRITKR